MNPWRTRKRGTPAQKGTKFHVPERGEQSNESWGNKTIFFPAESAKYSDIVSLRTPGEAEESADILMNEFRQASTGSKRLRILRVTQLAANRARASLKRSDLSRKEQAEYREIAEIYEDASNQMQREYSSLEKQIP